MFCMKCGKETPEGVRFCPNCGENISGAQQQINDAFDNMANGAQQIFQNAEKSLQSEFVDMNNTFNNTPTVFLKSDRSLLVYIVLSFITCGIYGYYFIYRLAQDVNVACAGDGDDTPGVVEFILFSIITCGFYSWYWYYRLGNRLSANASRYGMLFQENGTTVLLWCVFGMLICGIGPYVAMYIIIRNSNLIFDAYNRAHGLRSY